MAAVKMFVGETGVPWSFAQHRTNGLLVVVVPARTGVKHQSPAAVVDQVLDQVYETCLPGSLLASRTLSGVYANLNPGRN
ncbi:MAG TPA: hypothetical protein VFX70_17580, partial [Mycobacteriales bacterium]|nr:hypothetical protein [Mycobacteriales bacterium]